MHNQVIERDLVLYYNCPSKRWKIRRIKTAWDKQLLKLDRESDELRRTIRNLGYEDLVPPIQRGWKRSFVLRSEVMQDKQALFYQQILDKINTIQHSSRKDFKVKKRRFGKRCYVVRTQQLKEPEEYDFNRMKFTEEQQHFFYKKEEQHWASRRTVTKYVFLESWRFVLKIEPNIITKTKIRDWELERRDNEIRDYLDKNKLNRRLDKLYGYSANYWVSDCKKMYINPLKNKSVHAIMDEYYKELEK